MHVAIIMDGNGRWATQRGLPRTAGHIEGAKTVRATVEWAARANVETLTLYAFSAANWARPSTEIAALMRLFGQYLFTETRRCIEQSIRLNVIGRRDRLSENLLRSIEQSERSSAAGSGMLLRIAVDYSSQYSIAQATQLAIHQDRAARSSFEPRTTPEDRLAHENRLTREDRTGGADGGVENPNTREATISAENFQRLLHEVDHSIYSVGAVDLLIRTGNERRLSDFLLWECAFAELHFSECYWPDFDESRFRFALEDYNGRQRRFGALASKSV